VSLKLRSAFTLMEVNLAILVMAGGILSIVGLYSLGFRESRQSSEDVVATAYADAVISPLAMAISATNLRWSAFKNIDNFPGDKGWAEYLDENTGLVKSNPDGTAKNAFSRAMGAFSGAAQGAMDAPSSAWPSGCDGGLNAGLIVMHAPGSPIVRIGFRASKLPNMLLSAPLYYTEVRFQGVND